MSDPIRASDMMQWGWNMARGLGTQSVSALAINAATAVLGTDNATALLVSNIGAGFTGTLTIGGEVTAHQGSSGGTAWPVNISTMPAVSVGTLPIVNVGTFVATRITADQGSSGAQAWPVQISGTGAISGEVFQGSRGTGAASGQAWFASVVNAVSAIQSGAWNITSATVNQGASGAEFWRVQQSGTQTVSVSAIPSIVASISAIPAISVSAIPSVLASVSAIPAISVSANPSQLVSVSAIPSIAVSAITLPGVTITGGTMTVNAATVASHAVSINNFTEGTLPVSIVFPTSSAPVSGTMVKVSVGNPLTVGITGTLGVSFPLADAASGNAASMSNTAGSSSVTITGWTETAPLRKLVIMGATAGNGNTGANTIIFFTTNAAASGDLFTFPLASNGNSGAQWDMQYPFSATDGRQCTLAVRMSTSGRIFAMGAIMTVA